MALQQHITKIPVLSIIKRAVFQLTALFASYLFLIALFCFTNADAEDVGKSESLILEAAERFFISLQKRDYKIAWELLSEKSHKTIIEDVYNASQEAGIKIKKEDIINDFNNNGVICNNYWRAVSDNFDPSVVLNERVWEFEKIRTDTAVIMLKEKAVTRLQMYKENNQWKVGFIETFWPTKTMKAIRYLNFLFLK